MFYIPDLLSPEYLPLSLQLTSARLIKIQPPRDSRADAPPPRVPKMKKLLATLCFFHWSLYTLLFSLESNTKILKFKLNEHFQLFP